MPSVVLDITQLELVVNPALPSSPGGPSGGVTDHGDLTGLSDDDHTQYFNTTRGDARYYTKTAADAAFSAIAHAHDDRYFTESESDARFAAIAHNHSGVYSPIGHTHDDRYFTESETTSLLAAKADLVGGVIPTAQIPAIAITAFLGTVANQSAMLALSGQFGDWCIRSDTSTTWVITGSDPTVLANWTALGYPTAPVTSVNGQTGTIVLTATSIGASADGQSLITAANYATMRGLLTVYSDAETDEVIAEALAGLQPADDTLTALAGWDWSSGTEIATQTALNTISILRVGTGANNLLQLSASPGTPDGTKYLRDDLTWAAASGSSPTIVCVAPASDITLAGNNATYTSISDLTATVTSTGKYEFELMFISRLTSSGITTGVRMKLGTATISAADGDPVGLALAQGATGAANMSYTSATGVISGNSKSSGDSYVMFLLKGTLDFTGTGTILVEASIAGTTAGQKILKTSKFKLVKL